MSMRITLSDHTEPETDLREAIEGVLSADLCMDVVNLAFSEDGSFENYIFFDSDTFFDTLVDTEPYEVARAFFMGEDLDTRGPANPTRDYFRFNGYENVESTDDPGEIYSDTIEDDIIDYIMEHLDLEYPEDIQEIIDEYNTDKGDV